MKVDKEQLRLNAIKLKRVWFLTKCECCGKLFRSEKMWCVKRWGVNKTHWPYYYCQGCMHSKQEVLNEVDTDESPFGIFGVDDVWNFEKKSYARMDEQMEKTFPPLQKPLKESAS